MKAGREGDHRGWDSWMASLPRWTWVWAGSGSGGWTGKPGVLQPMGSQRIGHDWATKQQQYNGKEQIHIDIIFLDNQILNTLGFSLLT